ncbi:MAG: hypothetical protein JNM14_06445 [Ferruginibacter sp.]|nr:hypothetical protein [Ferruginibacter sp.]
MFFCTLLSNVTAFPGNAKLHITTDKENYSNAEIIQFQILLLNPSAKINNTLFVELLDCNGNRLTKQMLPFNLNVSSGHVVLPETGKGEFYLLYCYVNNADGQECSSIKKVFIKNNSQVPQKKAGNNIYISSFFEGGTFVAESPNNILVQCTDENLNPVVAKGKITDGKTNIYAVFETNELGFAKVILNPEDKVRYYIEVKDKQSKEARTTVPIAASTGITLNTTVNESSIIYNLISYTGATDNIPDYRMEAVCSDSVVYDAAISFQNGLSAVKEELKRENFPAGFITFRLTDKSRKIYARRVVYNSRISAPPNFISVIDTANKREAKIALPDMISGKASIQIKKADSASAAKKDLDFLAVTDRISINDQLIATAEEPSGFNALNSEYNRYLSLSGILSNGQKKPLKNKNVNIILQQKNFKKQYLVTKTDNEGRLQIDNLIFFDTVTVYYQLADKSAEKNDVFLELKVVPSKENPNTHRPGLNFLCGPPSYNADSSNKLTPDKKELKEVIVKADKEKTESEKFADKYVSGQMKKSQGTRNEFDFIKNPEEVDNRSLFDFLKGRMPGLKIIDNADGTPTIRGTNGGTVGVYLNDMDLPESNLSSLAGILIRDVAMIKYHTISLKPKTGLRNELMDIRGGDAGDLLIYTRQDFSAAEEKIKGLSKTTLVGYTLERKDELLTISSPNNAPLFWKADWSVQSGEQIFLNLPAADLQKDIEITIEGINAFLAPFRFTQKLVFK